MPNINANAKPGDVVVFTGSIRPDGKLSDIQFDKEYTIAGIDGDGDTYLIDDIGDRSYAADKYGNGLYKIVRTA